MRLQRTLNHNHDILTCLRSGPERGNLHLIKEFSYVVKTLKGNVVEQAYMIP